MTSATVDRWAAEPATYVPSTFQSGRIASLIRKWRALPWPWKPFSGYKFYRVAFRAEDDGLAVLPWKRGFQNAGADATVNVSPTPPMAADIPLTFPLRFLQVNPSRSRLDVERWIGTRSWVGPAVALSHCSSRQLVDWRTQSDWPTAEGIHLAAHLPKKNDPALLSTAEPEKPLTLGGLGRLTGLWQTRLLVLECSTPPQEQAALLLGSALADRGGPAVLVVGPGRSGEIRAALEEMYLDLVHDRPLD
ncbi:MAG: hypothetical protein GY953_42300, partial [bacterium]|nr:hypothetical protein [bacterium]